MTDMTSQNFKPAYASAASSLQLEQVFSDLNRQSADLGRAWHQLESRVTSLSAELVATRTARIEELAAKEALSEKLSALMEAMPAGVVVIDRYDRVEEANAEAHSLLGRISAGCCWPTLVESRGCPDAREGEFETPDGRRLLLAYRKLDGPSCIALLTDVSEAKDRRPLSPREERLCDLGDRAAHLAHQLRTPISSAMLYLAQLTAKGQPEAVQAVAGRVQERLRKMERLIHGMLGFMRGDDEPMTDICLATLARQTVAEAEPLLERADAGLSLDCPERGPVISGQRTVLENALGNLLENALDCSGANPQIRLAVEAGPEVSCLSVTDNGPGVDPELEDAIFEPWFTTRPGGTGLGLALVASAAEAHGGRVRLSRPESGGSCFTLIFPNPSVKEDR